MGRATMGEKGMAVTYSVYAFDAYGTLFDVHAAVRRYASAFGPQADALSEMWRTKQLEYSWNRSLMGKTVIQGIFGQRPEIPVAAHK